MKKKLLMGMLMLTLAVGMTACGEKEATDSDTKVEESQEKDTEEQDTEEKEETKEEKEEEKEEKKDEQELPNWEGVQDRVGALVRGDDFMINIEYPSLIPTSYGCAYQRDPALVLVAVPGKDENNESISIENVEDTLTASLESINMCMQSYRGWSCSDFQFDIAKQEVMTINDMPTCMYEGTHSYVENGETITIPFAAYSFYTGQIENYSYFTVIVMDDSINQPALDPLPEGTIQAYAKKMVESVVIDN